MKSWMTSVFGLAAGGLNMFANGTNWKQILLSIGMAGIGLVAKDHNVSNSPTPLAVGQAVASNPKRIDNT